jgi:hypothetical protein
MRVKKGFLTGQADLLSVMILIATTIVVGVGFLGLLYPSVMDLVSRSELRSTLYNEQSLLVLYREYENDTQVCIGFLRVEPGFVAYALALVVGGQVDNSAISFPLSSVTSQGDSVVYTKTYCLINGDYYPCVERINRVVYVPYDILDNYIAKGYPGLTCISKSALTGEASLRVFIVAKGDLYEVGRVDINE